MNSEQEGRLKRTLRHGVGGAAFQAKIDLMLSTVGDSDLECAQKVRKYIRLAGKAETPEQRDKYLYHAWNYAKDYEQEQ